MDDKCKGCGAGRGCIGFDPCACCAKCRRCGEAHGFVSAPAVPQKLTVDPVWIGDPSDPNHQWTGIGTVTLDGQTIIRAIGHGFVPENVCGGGAIPSVGLDGLTLYGNWNNREGSA